MVRIENLSKTFIDGNSTVEALKNISLDIKKGDIFGIIGLSGAGKSTLIRCINRLEEPTGGSIYIDGENITQLDTGRLIEVRRRIGMIFQHFNLLNQRNCSKNIAFPLEIAGYKKREINERVEELLDLVELRDKSSSYPGQLSGGQKQRVAIARALATKADILLCDEATSALDPDTTKSILKLLKKINENLGITIIMITHQMEVVKEVCGRLAVISDGRIIEQGDTYDLFSRPKHPITKRFLNDISLGVDADYMRKRSGSKLLKITFIGDKAGQPVISELVKATGAEVNILSGSISHIQDKPYGSLVVDLKGQEEVLQNALQFLEQQKLYFEEIN